jgi:hypothetical protein
LRHIFGAWVRLPWGNVARQQGDILLVTAVISAVLESRTLLRMDNDRRLVVRDERSLEHDKACCVIAILLWGVCFIVQ